MLRSSTRAGRQLPASKVEGAPWNEVCSTVQRLERREQGRRLIEELPAFTDYADRWVALPLRMLQKADAVLNEGAARLLRDINTRSVLCDQRHPCEVSVVRDTRVGAATGRPRTVEKPHGPRVRLKAPTIRICLPRDVGDLNQTRVCDPWGERWQRRGAMYLDGWPQLDEDSAGGVRTRRYCADFDMESLTRWWRLLRSETPFLNWSNPWLSRHLAAKLLAAKQMPGLDAYLAALKRLLSSADGRAALDPRRSCAFVGSGHDLRCGTRRGREIDAHDAVFRANHAQQPECADRYLSPELLGGRTDFRVNCLYNSSAPPSTHAEVCVVPFTWWRRQPGVESVRDTARPCCEPLVHSSYDAAAMLPLVRQGHAFAFVNGAASFQASIPLHTTANGLGLSGLFPTDARMTVPAVMAPTGATSYPRDGLLSNSGGNALHAALALCDRVDVYGAGLFSDTAKGDKLYAHSYDDRLGRCETLKHGLAELLVTRRAGHQQIGGFKEAPRWVHSRIQSELLLHVLHAFDVIQWVQ